VLSSLLNLTQVLYSALLCFTTALCCFSYLLGFQFTGACCCLILIEYAAPNQLLLYFTLLYSALLLHFTVRLIWVEYAAPYLGAYEYIHRCIHTQAHGHLACNTHVHFLTHTNTHVYIGTHAHPHIPITHPHTHTHVHTHTCVSVCVFLSVCVCLTHTLTHKVCVCG
jgi:hypothetical protein